MTVWKWIIGGLVVGGAVVGLAAAAATERQIEEAKKIAETGSDAIVQAFAEAWAAGVRSVDDLRTVVARALWPDEQWPPDVRDAENVTVWQQLKSIIEKAMPDDQAGDINQRRYVLERGNDTWEMHGYQLHELWSLDPWSTEEARDAVLQLEVGEALVRDSQIVKRVA